MRRGCVRPVHEVSLHSLASACTAVRVRRKPFHLPAVRSPLCLRPHADRRCLIIFLTVFIDLLGFGMVLPLLPIYGQHFAEMHGFSEQQTGVVVGLLMSSFSAMQFLFLPIWGRLSDRFGRRPIVILGLAGSTLFYAMFGVGHDVAKFGGTVHHAHRRRHRGGDDLDGPGFHRRLHGEAGRAKGMALIGAAFALGLYRGASARRRRRCLAGGEAATSPWPGFLAAALSGVALLLAIFRLPESLSRDSESAARSLFDRRGLQAALSQTLDRVVALGIVRRGILLREFRIDAVAANQADGGKRPGWRFCRAFGRLARSGAGRLG